MRYYHPRYLFRRYELMRRIENGAHFLEIGPGELALAQDLLKKFTKGTLIDFNSTNVELTYRKLDESRKERLELIIADFIQYQFGQQFDCVVACEVLEHIEDDRVFLRKVNDLLKNRGQLILSVPARQKYWSKDDEIVGHFRRYEKQELYGKLIEADFKQIKIIAYGFPFQNLVRLGRIGLARLQYDEKVKWDKRQQTQQSAFMIEKTPWMDLIGIVLNQYTIYPFNVFASLFNEMDLSEGYVVSATKEM